VIYGINYGHVLVNDNFRPNYGVLNVHLFDHELEFS